MMPFHLTRDAASPKSGETEAVVLDMIPEEHPLKAERQEASGKTPERKPCWEAFSKDMEIVKEARQAYHPSHKGMFTQEGSYDLILIFREMAWETNLLNTEIHEVQEVWAMAGRN